MWELGLRGFLASAHVFTVPDGKGGLGTSPSEVQLSIFVALEEYCADVLHGVLEPEQLRAPSISRRLSLLFDNRDELSGLLASAIEASQGTPEPLMAALLQSARWYLHKLNQFVVPSESEITELQSLLNRWLGCMKDTMRAAHNPTECAAMMAPANEALHQGFNAVMVPHLDTSQREVLSEQYSAETQLTVLHLHPELIAQPLLDIGCGRDASFVLWLRQRGINAIGVDSFAASVPGCMQADWLQFPYLPEQFGTVTAHLSFSLHFLHQHLRPQGEARAYAVTYMSILRSLRCQGRFAYAPGLPFIERILPADQYKVEKHPIAQLPIDQRATEFFQLGLGESPMYSTHVVRL